MIHFTNKTNYILVLISIIFMISCNFDYQDNRLGLLNKTDRFIYFIYEEDTIMDFPPIILDSIKIINTDTQYFGDQHDFLSPNSRRKISLNYKWETYFDKALEKKIRLFIYDRDTISKYAWKKICQQKKYLKKYELTLDDVKKMNWTIVYEGK
jgi:hypothetical protein